MNIIDIKREIALSKLLDTELPNDIKELINYFKELTYIHENGNYGMVTWRDSNDIIRISFVGEIWNAIQFSHESWIFLRTKYSLNNKQGNDFIITMLGIVTNRIFPVTMDIWWNIK